jgi:uncharacterized damage-inducible protein DinB
VTSGGLDHNVTVRDRRTPFTIGDEKQTLVDFLDYLRHSVILKADGLSDDTARLPGVPSGTSLLGLIKHLTYVEIGWFHFAFGGLDVALPSGDLEADDNISTVVAAYREACERSNEIVGDCDDLDELCPHTGGAPERMTRRWVLVHLVEETARHAGHADIIRERIDGTVGR